jgi:Methyltransferase domain
MNDIQRRIESLDISLYEVIPAQLGIWDRRALLGLHAAVATSLESFSYLEIGSYLGGSLQVLVRDPSCARIISIDPRLSYVPDPRVPEWEYEDNTTEHMMSRLRRIPDADTSKLVVLDTRSEDVSSDALPGCPSFCFIDGEHTDEAVLRDAELCMAAIDDEGLIAFHDSSIVRRGICEFLTAHWGHVSTALAFTGEVFAVEIGDRKMLRSAVIQRAVGSTWHTVAFRLASRWGRSPCPLFATWAAIPHVDALIFEGRRLRPRPKRTQ